MLKNVRSRFLGKKRGVMFPLLLYFSLASLIALALVTAVIVVLSRNIAVSRLEEMGEADNVALTQVLANFLWPRFSWYVASVSGSDADELRTRPETAEIFEILGRLQRDLPVLLKVKIYNTDGLTVFSSDESQIGEDKSGNPGFRTAVEDRSPASKLSRRGRFSAFSGEVYDRSIVETYIPVGIREGPVEGVFEVYSDVTPLMDRIDETQNTLILSLLALFALLYGTLFLIVRNADRILKHQYAEILAREADVLREKDNAEAAARAESEFLANMSHEIRTPASAMLGFAEVLAEENIFTDSADRRVHAIETIRKCGEHLLEIIDRVLDRARLKAARVEIDRIPFSPTAVAEEVLAVMRPRAEAKGLALELEVDSSTPAAIESDATRIRQILMNLVGNGIKFTEAGSVRVSVGHRSGGGQSMIRFEVADTGVGLSPVQAERIFEPFTQVRAQGPHETEGTGLGLTISKGLTALLGGTIRVESKPGEGSLFRVDVPCISIDRARLPREGTGASALQRRDAMERAGPGDRRLDVRVLVAEDNHDNQRLLAEILRAAGAEAEFADNGAIALERVREEEERGRPFGAVLVDMQMPVMGGCEAASTLREMGYAGLILALTAHSSSTDRQRCINAGCNEYLTKPIDRYRLVEIMERYARRAR
jgi:signal transduction histidine kinase/CheY-like chemotaxis protein